MTKSNKAERNGTPYEAAIKTPMATARVNTGSPKAEFQERIRGLIEQLDHAEGDAYIAAHAALVEIGEEAAQALLNRVLLSGKDSHKEIGYARAFGALDEIILRRYEPVRVVYIHRLCHHDTRIRHHASIAVANEVQEYAARYMPHIPDSVRTTLPALFLRLFNGAAEDAHNAANALGKLGEPALPLLLSAMVDAQARGYAFSALANMGEAAVPSLKHLLKHRSARVRCDAAWALGHIGTPDSTAVPMLCGLLGDRNAEVRTRAAWALGQIGEPSIWALAIMLRNEDPRVRRHAAQAVGYIGEPASELVPAFRELLSDNRRIVRLEAAETLSKLGQVGMKALSDSSQPAAIQKLSQLAKEKRKQTAAAGQERLSLYVSLQSLPLPLQQKVQAILEKRSGLKWLKTLCAVRRAGSYTGAAAPLGISEQAVQRQVTCLLSTGRPIALLQVNKGNQGVRFTAEGNLICDWYERHLNLPN